VPEISRFFGIVIRMFVEAGGQHHRPHFHAYYQDHAGVFALDTIEGLGGSLPKAQQRLVRHGRRFIEPSCNGIGISCNPASHRSRSIR